MAEKAETAADLYSGSVADKAVTAADLSSGSVAEKAATAADYPERAETATALSRGTAEAVSAETAAADASKTAEAVSTSSPETPVALSRTHRQPPSPSRWIP